LLVSAMTGAVLPATRREASWARATSEVTQDEAVQWKEEEGKKCTRPIKCPRRIEGEMQPTRRAMCSLWCCEGVALRDALYLVYLVFNLDIIHSSSDRIVTHASSAFSGLLSRDST
jgi:hypothetical protein